MSKSLTSTAVGLAVAEGRLTPDDKVISFLPESLPPQITYRFNADRVTMDFLSSITVLGRGGPIRHTLNGGTIEQ